MEGIPNYDATQIARQEATVSLVKKLASVKGKGRTFCFTGQNALDAAEAFGVDISDSTRGILENEFYGTIGARRYKNANIATVRQLVSEAISAASTISRD